MSDADKDYELPDMPLPDGGAENLFTFLLGWVAIIGLALPAYAIGWPRGWFVYAGTLIAGAAFMELKQLNNILVRTLPALRLTLTETKGLRRAAERKEPKPPAS